MLPTKQPILKRFWYPTLPLSDLAAEPKPFELLGQKIVLWLDKDRHPVALKDRCPHRSVPLSNDGAVIDGEIRCGYHGWRFGVNGECTLIPQSPEHKPSRKCRVESYHCVERYGFVWVCLGEPLIDIPYIAEAYDSDYRFVSEYSEVWQCNAFRVTENALDLGHISFVHRKTIGDEQSPVSPKLKVAEIENGVEITGKVPVANYEDQQKNLQIPDDRTLRIINIRWLMPCSFTLCFTYPNGLIHKIVGFATPMTDSSCYRIQFCLRNDTEADAPAKNVAHFDWTVGQEDRNMLESADYDLPLDLAQEHHMILDQAGIMMRRQLLNLLKMYGEVEQRREVVEAK